MKKLFIIIGLLIGQSSTSYAMEPFIDQIRNLNWPSVATTLNNVSNAPEAEIAELLKFSATDLSKQTPTTCLLIELLTASLQKGMYDSPGSRHALKTLIAAGKIDLSSIKTVPSTACQKRELVAIVNELRTENHFGYVRYPLLEINSTGHVVITSPVKAIAKNYKFWTLSAAVILVAAGIYWYTSKSDPQDETDEQEDDSVEKNTNIDQVPA